ncbi:MAG: hypothetical protein R3F13_18575, partial [Prosthecobacter sp.]
MTIAIVAIAVIAYLAASDVIKISEGKLLANLPKDQQLVVSRTQIEFEKDGPIWESMLKFVSSTSVEVRSLQKPEIAKAEADKPELQEETVAPTHSVLPDSASGTKSEEVQIRRQSIRKTESNRSPPLAAEALSSATTEPTVENDAKNQEIIETSRAMSDSQSYSSGEDQDADSNLDEQFRALAWDSSTSLEEFKHELTLTNGVIISGELESIGDGNITIVGSNGLRTTIPSSKLRSESKEILIAEFGVQSQAALKSTKQGFLSTFGAVTNPFRTLDVRRCDYKTVFDYLGYNRPDYEGIRIRLRKYSELQFTHDGSKLIVCTGGNERGTSGQWSVFETETWNKEASFSASFHCLGDFDVSPNGTYIAICGIDAGLFETNTGKALARFAELDTRRLSRVDGRLALWDHIQVSEKGQVGLKGHRKFRIYPSAAVDAHSYWTISAPGHVNVTEGIAAISFARQVMIENGGSFAKLPDSSYSFSGESARDAVSFRDLSMSRSLPDVGGRWWIPDLVLEGGVAVGFQANNVYVAPLENLEGLTKLEGHFSNLLAMDLTPDGHVVIAGGLDSHMSVWSSLDGRLIGKVDLSGLANPIVMDCAISPDLKWIAARLGDGAVHIWKLTASSSRSFAHDQDSNRDSETKTLTAFIDQAATEAISSEDLLAVRQARDRLVSQNTEKVCGASALEVLEPIVEGMDRRFAPSAVISDTAYQLAIDAVLNGAPLSTIIKQQNEVLDAANLHRIEEDYERGETEVLIRSLRLPDGHKELIDFFFTNDGRTVVALQERAITLLDATSLAVKAQTHFENGELISGVWNNWTQCILVVVEETSRTSQHNYSVWRYNDGVFARFARFPPGAHPVLHGGESIEFMVDGEYLVVDSPKRSNNISTWRLEKDWLVPVSGLTSSSEVLKNKLHPVNQRRADELWNISVEEVRGAQPCNESSLFTLTEAGQWKLTGKTRMLRPSETGVYSALAQTFITRLDRSKMFFWNTKTGDVRGIDLQQALGVDPIGLGFLLHEGRIYAQPGREKGGSSGKHILAILDVCSGTPLTKVRLPKDAEHYRWSFAVSPQSRHLIYRPSDDDCTLISLELPNIAQRDHLQCLAEYMAAKEAKGTAKLQSYFEYWNGRALFDSSRSAVAEAEWLVASRTNTIDALEEYYAKHSNGTWTKHALHQLISLGKESKFPGTRIAEWSLDLLSLTNEKGSIASILTSFNSDDQRALCKYISSKSGPQWSGFQSQAAVRIEGMDFEAAKNTATLEAKKQALRGFLEQYPRSMYREEIENFFFDTEAKPGDFRVLADFQSDQGPAAPNVAPPNHF